jgi:hypothetical protein
MPGWHRTLRKKKYKYTNGGERQIVRHTLDKDDFTSDAGQGKVACVDVCRDAGRGKGRGCDGREGHSGEGGLGRGRGKAGLYATHGGNTRERSRTEISGRGNPAALPLLAVIEAEPADDGLSATPRIYQLQLQLYTCPVFSSSICPCSILHCVRCLSKSASSLRHAGSSCREQSFSLDPSHLHPAI